MLRTLCTVLALVAMQATALAQSTTMWSLFSPGDFRPAIGPSKIKVIIRALDLNEAESAVVADLHAAHVQRVRDEGTAVRNECVEIIERTQLLGTGEGLDTLLEAETKWRERRKDLDDEFLQELRLILTAEQEQSWSIVERELRRMDQLPRGRMAGESIDVIALVDGADIEITDALSKTLDRYARAMDASLRARASFFEEHSASEVESLLTTDPEQARRIFERARKHRMDVRDINRRFMDALHQHLDPEDAKALREAFVKQVSGRVATEESITDRAIAGAKGLTTLSDDQKRRLTEIEERYATERMAWTDRYVDGLMEIEEETVPLRLALALRGESPDAANDDFSGAMSERQTERTRIDELATLWEQRLKLDRRTRRDVEAILTGAQRTDMPLLMNTVRMISGQVYASGSWLEM
jgi:hypothetical protein